jgi:hypothetical protein
MQKNDRPAISRAGFGVANAQQAGIDLLQRAERRVRPPVHRYRVCRAHLGRTGRLTERHGRNGTLGSSHQRGALGGQAGGESLTTG